MALANVRTTMRPVATPLTQRVAPVGADLDFDPRDIGRLAFWTGGRAIPGLVHGDPIAAWPDRSGWGRHAPQATASKRATYREGARKVARLDGVDDDAAPLALTLTDFTITCATGKLGSVAYGGYLVATGGNGLIAGGVAGGALYGILVGNNRVARTNVSYPTNGTSFEIVTGHRSGSAYTLIVNGANVTEGPISEPNYSNSPPVIGQADGSARINADIGELIAHARPLLLNEVRRLQRRQGRMYSVPVAA